MNHKNKIKIEELDEGEINEIIRSKVPIEQESSGRFENFKDRLKKSDIIVATPAAFFIIGEHSVMHGHPALYMPIPLYLYLGLKRTNYKEINIEVWSRSPNYHLKDRFGEFKWKNREKEELERKIKEIFDDRKYHTGYNISALVEIPSRCGLNSSGAFSAALSLASTIDNEGCGLGKILKWSKIDKLIKLRKDSLFNDIFDVAWKIDWKIQNGSSGIGPFASLVGSNGSPIIYFIEKSKTENYKQRKWYAWFLSEILKGREMEVFARYWFSLIYSGEYSRTSDAFSTLQKTIERSSENVYIFMGEILKEISDIIEEKDLESISTPLRHLLEEGLKQNPDFGGNGIENVKRYLLEKIFGVMGGFSLIAISNIIHQPDVLTSMINAYQTVLSSLRLSTKEINEICNVFSSLEGVGVKLTGSGGGGDVLVISRDANLWEKVRQECKHRNYIVHFEYKGSAISDLVSNVKIHLNKLYPLKIDVKDKPDEEAYIGIVKVVRLKEDSKYSKEGTFSPENLKVMESLYRLVDTELENIFNKLKNEQNIKLNALVFPEFSILPEVHQNHEELLNKLQEISSKHDVIIIGGSYLTENSQGVSPVIIPSRGIEKQFKLWRSKYDPDDFIEGNGLKIFTNTKIGNFCVLICYDFTSGDKIPEIIRNVRYELRESFTLFVVACNPAKEDFKNLANKYIEDVYCYVIISDSFGEGMEYCADPMEKKDIAPIHENEKIVIYKLQIGNLARAFERKIRDKKSPRAP